MAQAPTKLDKPFPARLFLDTSPLFAGIWSQTGGARMLLRLGETGIVRLHVSAQVLQEIEAVFQRKAPELVPTLALVLERSKVDVISHEHLEHLRACQRLTGHPADGRVLAEAWSAGVNYFVTLDREHFLANAALVEYVPFPIGTPGDCLVWLREHLSSF